MNPRDAAKPPLFRPVLFGDHQRRLAVSSPLSLLLNGTSLALLALGVCWFFFFAELSGEWGINAQYSYGYVVPLLALALIWRRWPDRPRPLPASSFKAWLLAAGLLFLLLPIRVVLQANPEWRLIYWLHGLQTIGLALCLLYRLGGWPWVRFFAPPVLFTLIAVPWPMNVEQWAVQNLMRFVASLTVEVAGWFAIPAVQHGNLIETTVGVVGIDEACSGVRSLQSAFMLSLFLGEMHRLTAVRRVGLLGASLVFDLLANVTRTSFLVWAAANRGMAQMEAWHDTAGLLVMIIVLPSLLGLAYLMKPRIGAATAAAEESPAQNSQRADGGEGIGTSASAGGSFAERQRASGTGLCSIPLWAGVLAFLWIGAEEAACEVWYRVHESHLIDNPRWSVVWPAQSPHFKKSAVPDRSLAILRCSSSAAATWEDEAGYQWSAFLLRWNPGRNSAQLAKGHSPDICFPASGAHRVADFGKVTLPVRNFEIPFRHLTFDRGGDIVHVFYCLWPDRVAPDEKPLLENGTELSRLLAVLAGKRNLGQQELEVVVAGPESESDAVATFKRTLPKLIETDPAQ